jgi:hypothetical protein
MENPGRVHWEAVKCVLRYLKGTRDWKLVYGGGEARGLEGFTDADRAMQEHRWAISGYIMGELFLGVRRSRNSLHYQLLNRSTLPLLTPPRNSSGSDTSSEKSFDHLNTPLLFTRITSPQSLSLIRKGSFMPAQNISTLGGIISATQSKMALLSSFTVLPRT